MRTIIHDFKRGLYAVYSPVSGFPPLRSLLCSEWHKKIVTEHSVVYAHIILWQILVHFFKGRDMSRKARKVRIITVKKRLVFLTTVVIFFLIVWLFFSYNVNPIIRKVSEEKVRELSTTAVNNAAAEVIADSGIDYENILEITKNAQNEIELLRVNTLLLNSMARKIVTLSQSNISGMGAQGIAIPLGTLSGMTFLTGQGPEIKIKVYPVGAVSVSFASEFVEAGINQTRHKITLFVKTGVNVIMPGLNKTVNIVTEVALCENIIIGKVPDVYLRSNSIDEMMHLIP